MQHWIGIGRITKQPELRHTNSGKAVASFTLAVDGDKRGDTDFIDVVAWNKTAELAAQYLDKGRMVAIEGKWHKRSYENRDGQKVNVWEVTADKLKFLDRGEGGNNSGSKQTSQSTQPARSYDDDPFADDTPLDVDTDNLPF